MRWPWLKPAWVPPPPVPPPHEHSLKARAVQYVGPNTVILWRCICGAVNSSVIGGRWTLGQILGVDELPKESDIAKLIGEES